MSSLIRVNTFIDKANASVQVANKLLSISSDVPELIPFRKKDKWGFCDRSRKVVIDCIYAKVKPFSEDLAAVCVMTGAAMDVESWGFISKLGETAISHQFDFAHSFNNGIARVGKEDRMAIIDRVGNFLVGFTYYFIDSFSGGLAVVDNKKHQKYVSRIGYLNAAFEEVIPCTYEKFWHYENCRFKNSLALVKKDLNNTPPGHIYKNGLIDEFGVAVVPLEYYWLAEPSEGFLCAQRDYNNQWGFINCSGDEVAPFEYDCIHSFSDGLAQVHKGGKYGYIDHNGNFAIPIKMDSVMTSNYQGHEFEDNLSFSFGLAPFRNDGKFGFINKSGDIAIPCKYDCVFSFRDGLAMIVQDGKVGFVNTVGEIVIQPEYDYDWYVYFDSNGSRRDEKSFDKGMVKVRKDNQWGVINKTGGQIIPCKYYQINDFENGLAWATLNYKHKGGYIGMNGIEYWED